MTIEKEDFDAWRDNPITQAVMKRVSAIAEEAKQHWLAISWEGGSADPLILADLRAKATIANDLVNLKHEDIDDEEHKRRVAD
jgi:hypothetical protein